MTDMRSDFTLVRALGRLPPGIWALGVVSLLMELSNELIHSLLPLFMVTTLGASPMTVGVIEGVAAAGALLLTLGSGLLSDWLRRRKLRIMIGYALGGCASRSSRSPPAWGWCSPRVSSTALA